ncbi:hypothetical protein C1H46_036721 [Malus baccata]|uniref:Uncharacterized protein n=1 Tax=Malus baccata TaxID=106549 RepID=A0A540KU42_MALBA|nr:hypothetical protein C1H46_036721 [Malus baccata]
MGHGRSSFLLPLLPSSVSQLGGRKGDGVGTGIDNGGCRATGKKKGRGAKYW